MNLRACVWWMFKTLCLSLGFGLFWSAIKYITDEHCGWSFPGTFVLYAVLGLFICILFEILSHTYGCPDSSSCQKRNEAQDTQQQQDHSLGQQWVDREESETEESSPENADANNAEATRAESTLRLRAAHSDLHRHKPTQKVSQAPARERGSDPLMTQLRDRQPCPPLPAYYYEPAHQLWIPLYHYEPLHLCVPHARAPSNPGQEEWYNNGRYQGTYAWEPQPRPHCSSSVPQQSSPGPTRGVCQDDKEKMGAGGVLVAAAAIGLTAHIIYHAFDSYGRPQELVNQAADCVVKAAPKSL